MISYALLIIKQISIEIAIFFMVFIHPAKKKLSQEELSDSNELSEQALSDFQNRTSSQPPLIWLQRIASIPNSEWIDSNGFFNVNHKAATSKISAPAKSIKQKTSQANVNQSMSVEQSEKEKKHNQETTNEGKELTKTRVEKNNVFASTQITREKKFRNQMDILNFPKPTLNNSKPPWMPVSDTAGGDDCRIDIDGAISQSTPKEKHKCSTDNSFEQCGTLSFPSSINAELYLFDTNVRPRDITTGIRDLKCSEMNSDQRQSPLNLSGLQKKLVCGEHKFINNRNRFFNDHTMGDESGSSVSDSGCNIEVMQTQSKMQNSTEKTGTLFKRKFNLQNVYKTENSCKENTVKVNCWPDLPEDNLFMDSCEISPSISMGDRKERREHEQTGFRWNVSRLY